MFNQTDRALAKLASNRNGYATYNSIGNQLRVHALSLAKALGIQYDTKHGIAVDQKATLQAIDERLDGANLISHYGYYQNEYSIYLKPEMLKQLWSEMDND